MANRKDNSDNIYNRSNGSFPKSYLNEFFTAEQLQDWVDSDMVVFTHEQLIKILTKVAHTRATNSRLKQEHTTKVFEVIKHETAISKLQDKITTLTKEIEELRDEGKKAYHDLGKSLSELNEKELASLGYVTVDRYKFMANLSQNATTRAKRLETKANHLGIYL